MIFNLLEVFDQFPLLTSIHPISQPQRAFVVASKLVDTEVLSYTNISEFELVFHIVKENEPLMQV